MQPGCVNVAFLRSGSGRARRVGAGGGGAARVAAVHWFFTGLLIAASAGTVAWTGHLLRRLFTTEPGVPDPSMEPAS